MSILYSRATALIASNTQLPNSAGCRLLLVFASDGLHSRANFYPDCLEPGGDYAPTKNLLAVLIDCRFDVACCLCRDRSERKHNYHHDHDTSAYAGTVGHSASTDNCGFDEATW